MHQGAFFRFVCDSGYKLDGKICKEIKEFLFKTRIINAIIKGTILPFVMVISGMDPSLNA